MRNGLQLIMQRSAGTLALVETRSQGSRCAMTSIAADQTIGTLLTSFHAVSYVAPSLSNSIPDAVFLYLSHASHVNVCYRLML